MRIQLLQCAIVLAFLSTSCREVRVIREQPIIEVDGIDEKNNEGGALEALDENLTDVKTKVSALTSLREEIERDKSTVDRLFDGLARLDLLDIDAEISEQDSATYYGFLAQAEQILSKIQSADIDTKVLEISDLEEASESEEKRHTESNKVRKVVSKIQTNAKAAKSEQEKITKIVNDISAHKTALIDKIDDAAREFGAYEGDKKVEALNDVLIKLAGAKSLKEIVDNVFGDQRFFKLEAEINREPRFGQLVAERRQELLDAIKEAITAALQQKRAIENYFDGTIAAPTNQDGIDRIARSFGALLDVPKLVTYATTRGVERAEELRKNAVEEILDPHRARIAALPAGAAPPAPVFGEVLPKLALRLYKEGVEKINEATVVAANRKFNTAFAQLEKFYDPAKFFAVKEEVRTASDATSARYLPSYDNLVDALEPYTLDGLRTAFEDGGKVGGSDDEYQFYRNFIIVARTRFKEELFSRQRQLVNQRIEGRVSALKDWIHRNAPIATIEAEFATLDAVTTKKALNAQCRVIAANLALIVRKPIDCAAIKATMKEEFQTANRSVNLWDVTILKRNIKRIKENYETSYEKILGAGVKEEKVKLKIAGKDEAHDLQKGESDLKKGVKAFNDEFLQLAHHIDLGRAAVGGEYTNRSLTDDILRVLATENLGTARKQVIYSAVIDKYADELYPGMMPPEIAELGRGALITTKPLGQMRLVLSDHAMTNLMAPFNLPPEKTLVENMKAAALGSVDDRTPEGAGVNEFERVLDHALNAVDESGSKSAIETLAKFFKGDLKVKAMDAAALTGVDHSQDFSLTGQLGKIKSLVRESKAYKAIDTIAAINPGDDTMASVMILNNLSGTSIEELSLALPAPLALSILGKEATNAQIVTKFGDLKASIEASIQALISQADRTPHGNAPTHAMVQPMVNAFNLLFLHPLKELSQLNFDGTDDAAIASKFALFNELYAKKFKRLLSVVGRDHPIRGVTRRAIELLEGDGVAQGLKAKLGHGSVSDETTKLSEYVTDFLH